MDILISLLYTGAQDGWMTINGRAKAVSRKTKTDAAQPAAALGRALSYISLCIKDDTSHLGLDFPVNT